MARVAHFEIQAEDMEKLEDFYTKVFKWEVIKDEYEGKPYWRLKTGDKDEQGIGGGMVKKKESQPRMLNYIRVTNIDEVLDLIKQKNGEILVPKTSIPKMGWFATFKDPEGNIFGIMHHDESVN